MTEHKQNHEQSDFMKVIDDIRAAEEERDRIVASAKSEASNILLKTKEDVLSQRTHNEDSLVKFKNEKLKVGTDEIENAAKKIIDKTKHDSDSLRHKKLDAPLVSKMASEFLNKL